MLSSFLEFSIIGAVSGGIYVLVALSFVIVYKSTNIFNFATGEMMMIGTYFFYLFDTQLRFGWIAGLAAAFIAAAVSTSPQGPASRNPFASTTSTSPGLALSSA